MKILKKIKVIWKGFSPKEKIVALLLSTIAFVGLFNFSNFLLSKITVLKPAIGGTLNYGLWQAPKTINPIIGQNNDTDQDLISILFSSILKEDGMGGLKNDLAKEITYSADNPSAEIILKDNVYFHDGKKLTADDIIFTASIIKKPEYHSPFLPLLKDVKFEKLGENMVRVTLPFSNNNFDQILTFKIIPKHLWENVAHDQFTSVALNQKPVGSGPFVIQKVQKDRTDKITSLVLVRNKRYYDSVFINKINIIFYASNDKAFADFIKGKIDLIKEITPYQKDILKNRSRIKINNIALPRYYALFLNQQNPLLADVKVATALDLAIDKQKIADEVFFGDAEILNLPISKDFIGYNKDLNQNKHDVTKAKEILAEAGFKYDEEKGVMSKTKGKVVTNLEFSLLIPSINEIIHLTEILKKNLEDVGAKVNLQILPLEEIYRDYLKTRNYDALIFGQTYTTNPDLYYFWHSLQATNLGLNLSLYKDSKLDSLLELARSSSDSEEKNRLLLGIQDILNTNKPAIFLNNPYYINAHYKNLNVGDKNIYGSYSSFLSNMDAWFIHQKRALK